MHVGFKLTCIKIILTVKQHIHVGCNKKILMKRITKSSLHIKMTREKMLNKLVTISVLHFALSPIPMTNICYRQRTKTKLRSDYYVFFLRVNDII